MSGVASRIMPLTDGIDEGSITIAHLSARRMCGVSGDQVTGTCSRLPCGSPAERARRWNEPICWISAGDAEMVRCRPRLHTSEIILD